MATPSNGRSDLGDKLPTNYLLIQTKRRPLWWVVASVAVAVLGALALWLALR